MIALAKHGVMRDALAATQWTHPGAGSCSIWFSEFLVPVSTDSSSPGHPNASPDELNQRAADAELMRQVSTGSEAAFGSFYRRFAPGLFSMVYAILQDQREAEDVLQEAFVQMWKRASHYDGERGSVSTWAAMICRNKAIDRLRALGRRSWAMKAAETELAYSPVEEAGQTEALGQSDEHARVRAGLAQLPEAQREAIQLAFFGGLTHIEISSKTGVPLGTVKARIRRGLLALRSVWKL